MKNLDDAFVRHQCKKRGEIDAIGQGIDDHRFLRRRHLRHAQQRVISGLAQEFGIDGDEGMLRHARANRREVIGG